MMQVTGKALAAQRFLTGLQAGQLDALATTASEVMFPAGHRIFADGGYADRFWLIESGYVDLDVRVPGEGPAVVATVGIGGVLGWSWLAASHKWAFGAVCVTEVKAYQFEAAAVRRRCAADPALESELTRRLFEVVAGRVQDTTTLLIARSADASQHVTS
jgi:CRP-like cAMP-binding protein